MIEPATLAVYISGHGYGHLAQIAPVLEALHETRPDIQLLIRTELDDAVIHSFLAAPFEILSGPVDAGVIQKHAAEEDIPATLQIARNFFSNWEEHIAGEADRLGKYGPSLVLSDISPLAFPVAKKLGIPAMGLGSLDWHAVYSGYLPASDDLLGTLAEAHDQADMLLQPPLSMSMPSFPNITHIGLISRQATHDREKVRRHMSISDEQKLAMIMFGGTGDPPFDIHTLKNISGWQFGIPGNRDMRLTSQVQQVSYLGKFSTVDCIAAADTVICKPSYNTLAECWRYKIPLIYVPRPDFPEYPYLRAWMQKNAPAVEITRPDFKAANWQQALDAAVLMCKQYPETNMDGDVQSAEIISRYLTA